MTVKELLSSRSFQREFNRFKSLGGKVEIDQNKVILFSDIVPKNIVDTFAKKIKKIDTESLLRMSVK
jgi:hypothetical protein